MSRWLASVAAALTVVVAAAGTAVATAAPSGSAPQPPWPGEQRPATGTWAEVGGDGRTLTVHFFGKPATSKACGADYTATAWETSSRVRVWIREDGPAARATPCVAVAVSRSVTVELDRPLGGRTVVRLPEGDPVPVRDR